MIDHPTAPTPPTPSAAPRRGITALFVEAGGCYFGLDAVDPWDLARDARLYAGSDPVVAHPPCERWGAFSDGSPMRKNAGYVTGDDGGCFASALASLRRCGGVLEHPANSKAWPVFGLPKPSRTGWTEGAGGWVCCVEQGHYGHPARKRTWLFAVGNKPPDLIWGPSEQRLPAKRLAERGYKSAARCGIVATQSHRQRQRTPPEFRDILIQIARAS